MFDQLSAEILPSLIRGRHNNTNNNKAKCISGGTLRVLAGKNGYLVCSTCKPKLVIVRHVAKQSLHEVFSLSECVN
jgi:hypothetical protein